MNRKFLLLLCITLCPFAYHAAAQCTANITYDSPTTFCTGDSVILKAPTGTGLSYTWNDGSSSVGTNSPLLTVKTEGNYTVTVSDGSCTNTSAAVPVTVNRLPGASTSPSGTIVLCPGTTKKISVLLGLSLPGDPTTYTYQWKNGTATVGNVREYTASAAGTYRAIVKNDLTGCINTSADIIVTVKTPPAAVITPSGPVNICENGSVVLDAGAMTGYDYQWKKNGTPVGVQSTYTVTGAGDYKVIVKDTDNCSDSSAITTVAELPKPSVALSQADTAFCDGQTLILTAATADTNLSYLWFDASNTIPGASDSSYTVTTSGSYGVIVSRTDANQCTDTSGTVEVTVHDLPEPSVAWDGTKVSTDAHFDAYHWYLDNTVLAGAGSYEWTPVTSGIYSVMVTDSNGCSAMSDTLIVTLKSSAVDDLQQWKDQVRIYPNPARDAVSVISAVPVTVTLSTMEGKAIRSRRGAGALMLHDLPAGIYLLQVTDQNGVMIKNEKLIRQ